MRALCTYLVLLLLPIAGFGQQLTAKSSDDQLLIGQMTTITYSVKTQPDDTIVFVPKSDVISARSITIDGTLSTEGVDFEITDEFKDTFIVRQKNKEWIGQYVVTAWDSGTFILPGPSIIINDSTYTFEDVKLNCYLSDPIDGVDLYDIRENYAEIPPKPFSLIGFLRSYWWIIAIIVVVFAILLIVRRNKRRKLLEDEEDEDRPTSLKERTLIAIDALEKAKLWEKNQLKAHFVELSYILRSYLTSRYDVSLLEKTTYEASLILAQKGLNKETIEVIMRILSQSDMVKFAKSEPDAIAILKISTLAKQVVAETSPLDFDNVE